jgi:acyl-CoA reductase-like NAD-dependent aldehyde dehydrogenase
MASSGQLYVGGAWSPPTTGEVIEVVSPHTEEVVATVAAAGPEDVDRAVTAARVAFDDGPWPRLDPTERINAVRRLSALTAARRGEMAELITSEMGAPASFSKFAQATLPMMLLNTFADVDNGMRIAREEIFGPVLSVIPYGDADEAVQIANDSDYGLSGSVWTADTDRGLDVARRVRTGSFGVNQPYSMDPAAPFGGMKASGIGHELGREGLEGYLEVKAISVAPTPQSP